MVAKVLLLPAVAALAVGCLRNVPQHASSGKDFRVKGAKKITLEGNEGRARDIVTYPGGDRVDWKRVELPEGKKGELKVRMRFTPARPGMDLAFEVYDAYFERVGRTKLSPKGQSRKKDVKIKNAEGMYYIQVYAPRRQDAARYTLQLEFVEAKAPVAVASADMDDFIEPPSLPAVPAPVVADAQPQPVNPVMPEPKPQPDRDEPAPSVSQLKAKITRIQAATGGGVIVTINRGKKNGVARGWNGNLLQGSSDNPLDDGQFTVINVTTNESVAKVKLTIDQVKANPRVLLTAP